MKFFLVFLCFFTTLHSGLLETQFIFTQNTAKLIQYIYSKNYKCTFGETYRTPEQSILYAGIGKGIINSNHRERLAIDLNLFSFDDKYLTDYKSYEKFGRYWESLNKKNEWGGRFKKMGKKNKLCSFPDLGHFEMDL